MNVNRTKPKIGIVIYTYDRVDDAKINQELIRYVWKLPSDPFIVHAYNGQKTWYPKKHLEDILLRIPNAGHYRGAAELIDAGVKKLMMHRSVTQVVVLAADTWCIKPGYVALLINRLRAENRHLATCAWGQANRNDPFDVGLATDFFIFDVAWARNHHLFPLRYGEFAEKYEELTLYHNGGQISLEKLLATRLLQASYREIPVNLKRRQTALGNVLCLTDREPVHLNKRWRRKAYWPKIGLVTHHEPGAKRDILIEHKITDSQAIKKLLSAKNLDYFNNGRWQHELPVK